MKKIKIGRLNGDISPEEAIEKKMIIVFFFGEWEFYFLEPIQETSFDSSLGLRFCFVFYGPKSPKLEIHLPSTIFQGRDALGSIQYGENWVTNITRGMWGKAEFLAFESFQEVIDFRNNLYSKMLDAAMEATC